MHPLSSLGFAGKLVYGGIDAAPDGGAFLPADPNCKADVRATSVAEALGHDGSTHGSWGLDLDPLDILDGKFGEQNSCGDVIRQAVISAVQSINLANNPGSDVSGYPGFPSWPVWNDITHQAMWIDWIRRAHDAGLSVIVTLAVNNETLADAVAGPGDGPDDDKASADLQIAEIQRLVERHLDWMEIAYSSADVRRIVYNRKLAVVLGLEIDNIGDFNRESNLTETDIAREITRLKGEGIRYLFPIHLIDNPFGTTAAYDDIFNLSNLREAGHFWNLQCAQPGDHITYQYQLGNPLTQTVDLDPPSTLTAEMAGLMVIKLGMLSDTFDPPVIPKCPPGVGMVNVGAPYPGLTPLGKFAVAEMMRQGILVDIDHMSQAARTDSLALATVEKYPIFSGHNGVRTSSDTERSMTAEEYAKIATLHGMSAVGGARTDDEEWVAKYQGILKAMGGADGAVSFGTDAGGLAVLMRPPPAHRFDYSNDFARSSLGTSSWDYNDAGVAHYGMLADFMKALPALDAGAAVVSGLMNNAQYFADTWQIAEEYALAHEGDAGALASAVAPTSCPAGMRYEAGCKECLAPRGRCALARPACDPSRTHDRWGLCWTAHATRPAAAAAAPSAARGGSSLAPGEYTLVLAETAPASSGAPPKRSAKGFDVDVVPNGSRVVLHTHGTKQPATDPTSRGGFRGNRFVERLDTSDQVLVLIATGIGQGQITDVRGAYVVHEPDATNEQQPLTGTFFLRKADTMSRRATNLGGLTDLGPFVKQLRSAQLH